MKNTKLELNQTLIRPRFCDVDTLKIVHHSRYIPWLEEASFNFVENVIGISRKELMDMDVFNPIGTLTCDYKNGIKWHDNVLININMLYSKFAYFIMESTLTSYDNSKVLFAEAQVKHLYTDNNLKLKIIAPESFFDKIEEAANNYPEYFTKI